MAREAYMDGTISELTDSRRQKWVKILNVYQNRAGSLRSNDPHLGNSKREIAAKVLAALQGITVKG